MFCYEHALRVAGTGVTSTVMHPGLVRSGFGAAGYGLVGGLMHQVSPLIAVTPEAGADTLVWLASSPEVEGRSQDVQAQEAFWNASEELTQTDYGHTEPPRV